jgi:hypothetical protein
MAMSTKYLTLRQQEILGRSRRRAFDLADAIDLPALEVAQQHEHITYLDLVEDPIEGNGIYGGKAGGKYGGSGRWVAYEDAKRRGHAQNHEARGLHQMAFLKPSATLHLRPLMMFPKSVSSTLIEIMEGLMMDFLESIDRGNLNEVNLTFKSGQRYLLYNATMLKHSKDAFPSKRHSTSCKGLNKVSSLKQATFPSIIGGCHAANPKCSTDKRAKIVFVRNDTFQVCRRCKGAYTYFCNAYEIVGTHLEHWTDFIAVQKGLMNYSACKSIQHMQFPCKYGCGKFQLTSDGNREHEKACKENPERKTNSFLCKFAGCGSKPFSTKSNRDQPEKACKKNPERESFPCKFAGCESKPFGKSSHRTEHEKACKKNPERESFPCRFVGCVTKPSVTGSNRRAHEKTCSKNSEGESPSFQCQFAGCGTTLSRKRDVNGHEKYCKKNPANQQSNKEIFQCQFAGCGKTLSRERDVSGHEKKCKKNPANQEKQT